MVLASPPQGVDRRVQPGERQLEHAAVHDVGQDAGRLRVLP